MSISVNFVCFRLHYNTQPPKSEEIITPVRKVDRLTPYRLGVDTYGLHSNPLCLVPFPRYYQVCVNSLHLSIDISVTIK